jgi:Ulp1 family protease
MREYNISTQNKYGRIIQRYVKDVYEWYHEEVPSSAFIVDADFPQQIGSVDCGAFMCMYGYRFTLRWIKNSKKNFSSTNYQL